jgi:L-fucose isomerase-like protein
MPIVPKRSKILFLPAVRSGGAAPLSKKAKTAARDMAAEMKLDAIFPPDDMGTQGLISVDHDVREYWQQWQGDLSQIKALVVVSSDFMRERAIMDTVRLLPEDVPVFMILNNDDPAAMAAGSFGDSLCGSLSVHHNMRMLGRRITRGCRIDMLDKDCLRSIFQEYLRTIDGIEALRNMRLATVGVNPDAFATTFTNQMMLFRLGFSLHTYELLDMWGEVVLGGQLGGDAAEYEGPFGSVRLGQPIRKDDPRVAEAKARIAASGLNIEAGERKADLIARYFLWLQTTFERDYIDAGSIHCWPEVGRYFGIGAPCAFSMLANLLLDKPVVCEADVCHAIAAKLGNVVSGEPSVILDINNNGWDPRVFNAFHCSQTPVNWLVDGGTVGDYGAVGGTLACTPFTGISAATSHDAFHATVFTGMVLRKDALTHGSSGWVFVPNLPEVVKQIEQTGIHHFVAMKGHQPQVIADALGFKGIQVRDLSQEVGSIEDIEADLPPIEDGRGQCRVFSL